MRSPRVRENESWRGAERRSRGTAHHRHGRGSATQSVGGGGETKAAGCVCPYDRQCETIEGAAFARLEGRQVTQIAVVGRHDATAFGGEANEIVGGGNENAFGVEKLHGEVRDVTRLCGE